MLIVPEAMIAELVTAEDAFAAIEACFAAMARGEAYNFPVVREALGGGDNTASNPDWTARVGSWG